MTNKKLGLLLAPLLPLTAIGVVEVAGSLASMNEPAKVVEVRPVRSFAEPVTTFAKPLAPPAPPPVAPPQSMKVG